MGIAFIIRYKKLIRTNRLKSSALLWDRILTKNVITSKVSRHNYPLKLRTLVGEVSPFLLKKSINTYLFNKYLFKVFYLFYEWVSTQPFVGISLVNSNHLVKSRVLSKNIYEYNLEYYFFQKTVILNKQLLAGSYFIRFDLFGKIKLLDLF